MLLKVKNLTVLAHKIDKVPILRDINFTVPSNTVFTLAGNNGSGKSTLIKAITLLLDNRIYEISGEVLLNEKSLFRMSEDEMLFFRREKIKYVFQDAMNSFNPLKKMGYYFDTINGSKESADELLDYFSLPAGKTLYVKYPYELSGGMLQRIAFILALKANPDLLILDEPTSNLDSPVTNLLLHRLKKFTAIEGKSVLLVTQDIPFAKEISNKAAFLYQGIIKEITDVENFNWQYPEGIIPLELN